MLALWMFGTELERIWGTRYFLKFYFVTGIGAGVLTVLFSLLPFDSRSSRVPLQRHRRIGRDLRAAARLRVVLSRTGRSTCIPVPDSGKIFRHDHRGVWRSCRRSPSGGVANATHLGGLLVAYLFLKSARRIHPMSELKYRYLKWKINRVRRKFDVYSGGRANDWDRRVH